MSYMLFERHFSIGHHVDVMHAFWTTVLSWISYRRHVCSLDKSTKYDNTLMTYALSLDDSSQLYTMFKSCMLFGRQFSF